MKWLALAVLVLLVVLVFYVGSLVERDCRLGGGKMGHTPDGPSCVNKPEQKP